MVHQIIWNVVRVADELFIQRGSLVLDDFVFFSLSSAGMQVTMLNHSLDSCPVLFLWIRTSSLVILALISQLSYEYHLLTNPPVTLELGISKP